jgi:hypothetical protein
MTTHTNHALLIGQVLQTWQFGGDLFARLQITRPPFYPSEGGPLDLVTVALPGAVAHGIALDDGDHLQVSGFIRNVERQTKLSDLVKRDLPDNLARTRVPQIFTEVVAVHWQKISKQ